MRESKSIEFTNPTSGARYRARPVRPDDGPVIAALFEAVFRRSFDLDEWRWKYLDNPASRVGVSILVEHEGRAVGHHGAIPAPLNYLGQPHERILVQSGDAMVLREHRKASILTTAWRLSDELLGDYPEIEVTTSMPNEQSVYPVQHNYVRTSLMEQWQLACGGEAHTKLRARVERLAADARYGLEFLASYDPGPDMDELWRTVARTEALSVAKSAAYLDWKYRRRPDRSYRIMALRLYDQVVALAVAQPITSGRMLIVELMSLGKNVDFAHELLLRVADTLADEGVAGLKFVGKDPWYFERCFADFERVTDHRHPFFTLAAKQRELARIYENPCNWTISLGDNDDV